VSESHLIIILAFLLHFSHGCFCNCLFHPSHIANGIVCLHWRTRFHHQHVPLIILLAGTGCIGK
jgi:hypothetical protein